MASHLHLSRLQSPCLQINRACPWMMMTRTKPASLHSTTPPLLIPLSKRAASKLHAQGRGFGLTTISDDDDKQRQGGNNNNNNKEEGDDEEDAIPEAVFNRMLIRIVSFVGVPMASGIGLLYLQSTLKEQGIWESPGWVPFLTILLSFGTSALGIAYGTLSTSWDREKEGSLLGWEEALKNWPELWKEEEENR